MQPSPIAEVVMPDEPIWRVGRLLPVVIGVLSMMADGSTFHEISGRYILPWPRALPRRVLGGDVGAAQAEALGDRGEVGAATSAKAS
jgi:hypothetical protein